MLEKQFHGYYEKAESKKGITGEIMLQELERRLDNVDLSHGLRFHPPRWRASWSMHGHFTVNGKTLQHSVLPR